MSESKASFYQEKPRIKKREASLINTAAVFVVFVLSSLLAACGGGGGGSSEESDASSVAQYSGSVVKGIIDQADVIVYAVNLEGERTELVRGATNEFGRFELASFFL